MYLINELRGWWYMVSHLLVYPYGHFSSFGSFGKTIIAIVSIIVVAFLALEMFGFLCDIRKYALERYIVFPGRNAGIFSSEKRIQIVHFNPLSIFSKFWPEISHSKETSETIILFLIFFALMSKYLWFIFTFKILLLIFVLFVVIYVQMHGYVSLGVNLIIIGLCNLAYLTNFSIGFVDLTPHYTIHFWSWLHTKPLVINPTDQDINLNKYIYALLLASCYISVLRYIGNHFYWKMAKHQPAPWARDFVGEPMDGEEDAQELECAGLNTHPVEEKPLTAKQKRRKDQAKKIIPGTNITGEQASNLYFLAGKMVFDYQNEFGRSRKLEAELTKKLKEQFADLPFSFKSRCQMKMRRFYLEHRNERRYIELLASQAKEGSQLPGLDPANSKADVQPQNILVNSDMAPSNTDDINSYLKLLGFSMSAIAVMVSEYGNEHIAKVLDVLKQAQGHSNPKVEFLKLLEQGDHTT